jgi:hypothetical protein
VTTRSSTSTSPGATRARGRGWALWKALITLVGAPDDPEPRRVLGEILADHVRGH